MNTPKETTNNECWEPFGSHWTDYALLALLSFFAHLLMWPILAVFIDEGILHFLISIIVSVVLSFGVFQVCIWKPKERKKNLGK